MKTVTILGSTGSVGVNTLAVIRSSPGRFKVAGLAAGSRVEVLKRQIDEFSPKSVYLRDAHAAEEIRRIYGRRLGVFAEGQDLVDFCRAADADILVAASSGTSALRPVMDAMERGKRVALANKEILVVAGEQVMKAAGYRVGARSPRPLGGETPPLLISVDSEHSAIFQCLQGAASDGIERLILTGSGGPLREVDAGRFSRVSKEDVVNHPKWKMGRKISVDSATLMNKGLEIIEARWLFGVPVGRIEVLIHPEAIVHSMVEFRDGSVLGQLGATDMRLPIQYALCYPDRPALFPELRLDFSRISRLTFELPDRKRFPCLDIAYQAARQSGSAPCVLSAADEIAVGAYLEDRIGFVKIPEIIEKVLSRHAHVENPDLDQIQSIHTWALEETERLCRAV